MMASIISRVKAICTKKVALRHIRRHLIEAGLDVKREGDTFYASLVQDKDLSIRWKDNVLSVAAALPVEEKELGSAATVADATIVQMDMARIFLNPTNGEPNLWFTIDTICRTESQFEDIFGQTFERLLDLVRKYQNLRYIIAQTKQDKTMPPHSEQEADCHRAESS